MNVLTPRQIRGSAAYRRLRAHLPAESTVDLEEHAELITRMVSDSQTATAVAAAEQMRRQRERSTL